MSEKMEASAEGFNELLKQEHEASEVRSCEERSNELEIQYFWL